ncbi:MAG: penicillin acylase family protein [Proteobacteria bacterium]|nr:penicillin acylase family protein [Pseudomonadota bacterium]
MRGVRTAVAVAVAGLAWGSALGAQSLAERARARLARLDGTVTLPALDSAVEVRRDRWGVPHIYAKTQHDLFFAQGYVVAQDRLFQLEMWRRMGEGRLAEVLGPSAVGRDRIARLLAYRGDWNAEYRSYASDTRAILEAFTAGLNAYIAEVRDHPPIEFDLLGIKPEPWSPDVPLQRMAALSMTGNALTELMRAQLVAALGAERVDQLFPADPPRKHDPVRGLDYSGIDQSMFADFAAAQDGMAYPRIQGSNNWVVSGKHTASGKPLLANDPHRTIGNPSLRYLSHLVAPGWDVIGAGEPGVPGVSIGHNGAIAFGLTIVGMDQQDVYVESLKPCAQTAMAASAPPLARCYFNHGGWVPVRTVADTIRVKDEAPRLVTLEFTEHGPIVAEDTTRKRAFALKFVGTEPGTAGYLAGLSLDRATNWPMFVDAMRRWKLPTENMIYADTAGHVGWVASGLMPIRSWSGLLPVPGDGRYEWQGFLDVRELPQTYDPESGIIATANNNILPPGYTKPINYEWAAPYRRDRIRSVLEAGSKFTVDDFKKLQHDEFSIPASQLVPVLLAAAEKKGIADRADVAALKGWDFVMRADQAAPAIYEAWLTEVRARLLRLLLHPELATAVGRVFGLETLAEMVQQPDGRLGTSSAMTRDTLVLDALDAAVATLTQELGADQGAWKWGDLHLAKFPHPMVKSFDLPPARRGGDGSTVNATAGPGWLQTAGASYREVIDLADWDNSWATSTPGQSAQPGSAHYGDLLALWGKGEYFPLSYSRAKVEANTQHVLVLSPR